MQYKLHLILVLSLLLIPILSYAAPPVSSIVTTSSILTISPLMNEVHLDYVNLSLEFHVFNSTGYQLTNKSTLGKGADPRCFIHLYKTNGKHFERRELTYDGTGDFETLLSVPN